MKYGKDLFKKISQPIIAVDKQIKELQNEIEKLNTKLEENKNDFSVDTIKKNQGLESELETIQKALKRAENHRKKLIDDDAMNNYKEAKNVIDTVRTAEKHSQDDKVDLIKEKIVEIYELYDEAKKHDDKIVKELTEFVDSISPYLSSERVLPGVYDTIPSKLYADIGRPQHYHRMVILDFFREDLNGIEGIVPPPNKRITLDK